MKRDSIICNAPSCSMYKAPGSDYCFFHKSMYSDKQIKEVQVDKFNINGFKTQIQLFKHLWENRKRKCYVTGEDLNKYDGSVHSLSIYAHILRKSAFQEFKYYVNNIVFLSPNYKGVSIHHLFDNGSLEQILKFEEEHNKSFEVLFDLERIIFNEYVTNFGKKTPMRKIVDNYFKNKK